MVREVQYTSIRRVLDNLKDDPLMSSLSLEQTVRFAMRFMEKVGYPKLYTDKQEDVEIHEFRGLLPCDLISIVQVMDNRTGICLRAMTDSFPEGMRPSPPKPVYHPQSGDIHQEYIPPMRVSAQELSFKTQGRIIYTSFPEGSIRVAYKAVLTDEDGFPMIMDNEVYLDALESYITLMVYRQKFRNGKINANVLQEVQQSYAVAVKLLDTEMTTPSYAEAEAMSRYIQSLIPRVHEFDKGFKNLGDRQIIIKH